MKDNGRFIPQKESTQQIERQEVVTTVGTILGREIEEPKGLSLATAPAVLSRNGNRFELLTQFPLHTKPFLDFLGQISPVKFTSRFGVIADWTLPEDAEKEAESGSERTYYQDLLAKHANSSSPISHAFETFEEYRRDFIHTLQGEDKEVVQSEIRSQFHTMEDARVFVHGGMGSGEAKKLMFRCIDASLREETGWENLKEQVVNYMMSNPGLWKRRQRNKGPNNAVNRFLSFNPSFRDRFYTEFFAAEGYDPKLSDRQIVKLASKRWSHIESPSYGNIFFKKDRPFVVHQKDGELYVSHGYGRDRVGEVRIEADEDGIQKPLVEINPEYRIQAQQPLLTWIKNEDGSRQIVVEKEEDDEGNKLMGFLAVPYFEPSLREKWPKHMGLPESGRMQAMAQAQAPVLALMYKEKIAKESEILKSAEEYVEANGVEV